jgi:hypothetical protein
MNDQTCYFYYREGNFNVTVAYYRDTDDVLFGAAFCRKGDSFSKKRGKQIAEGRMNVTPAVVQLPEGPSKTPRRDVHTLILEELTACEYAPVRFSPNLTLKRFNTTKVRV